MKYAVHWKSDFRHLKEIDEIILDEWTGKDTLLISLDKLNIDKENQRVILNFDWSWLDEEIDEAIIYINKAREEGYNIAIQIPEDRELAHKMREAHIPYMFTRFANTIDRAYTQAMMGASDVYVTENLGFRIKDLQYLREQFGVKLRILPNIAQISGFTKEINPILKFWVRPEDTELYEPYIDVFEFCGQSRLSVVYEIYKDRRWMGDLNDIILDFGGESISNDSMPPYIGKQRLNCGQVCLAGRCKICTGCAEMAKVLDEAGVMVRRDKYKDEKTEEEKAALLKQFEDKLNELRTNEESM